MTDRHIPMTTSEAWERYGIDAAVSVDPETDTLRAACCEWTLETRWADTPLHRRLIMRAVAEHRQSGAHRDGRDESGSASGRLVALVCWSLTWTMLAFLLLVWFAPPGQAVRIVPGSPAASRDWCPNIEGTQSVQSYLWHYRIKVHKGHGPKAGEVRCLPRKSRGHK